MAEVADKRNAILDATLDLLVERGFAATPMADIARHAGVSAGIIYHYFDSKEVLITQLYREIKSKCIEAMVAGDPLASEGADVLRCLWFNAYTYYSTHPKETLFLEQYENWPGAIELDLDFHPVTRALDERFRHDMATGIFLDLPYPVFYELTFAVALSLAKAQIEGRTKLDKTMLETVADAVCRTVTPA